jgi:hypothetical protein
MAVIYPLSRLNQGLIGLEFALIMPWFRGFSGLHKPVYVAFPASFKVLFP